MTCHDRGHYGLCMDRVTFPHKLAIIHPDTAHASAWVVYDARKLDAQVIELQRRIDQGERVRILSPLLHRRPSERVRVRQLTQRQVDRATEALGDITYESGASWVDMSVHDWESVLSVLDPDAAVEDAEAAVLVDLTPAQWQLIERRTRDSVRILERKIKKALYAGR